MSGALNATFLTLIPKKDNPVSFGDFRPISLCNLIYKLRTKTITFRLKPSLSKRLSKEQSGFLKNRQILEVIGVTQECLHYANSKKLRALILKMDLTKAYYKVDWVFLHLVLKLEFMLML